MRICSIGEGSSYALGAGGYPFCAVFVASFHELGPTLRSGRQAFGAPYRYGLTDGRAARDVRAAQSPYTKTQMMGGRPNALGELHGHPSGGSAKWKYAIVETWARRLKYGATAEGL